MITLTKEELADILANNSTLARSLGAIEAIVEEAIIKSHEGNEPTTDVRTDYGCWDYLARSEKL